MNQRADPGGKAPPVKAGSHRVGAAHHFPKSPDGDHLAAADSERALNPDTIGFLQLFRSEKLTFILTVITPMSTFR